MFFKDYYKILEIEQNASSAAVKKAYRRLAMLYHPDRNPDNPQAEEKFKEILEAYEVLNDPEKRAKFDRIAGNQQKQQQTHEPDEDIPEAEFTDIPYGKKESGFSEFFRQFFSKKKADEYLDDLLKGDDTRGKITIDLEEAYIGSTRILNIAGEKFSIKIKPGIQNDQFLKIKEKGKPSRYDGRRGDLYVRIVVRPHKIFERIANDLHTTLRIDIYTIILGGKIKIKTFRGNIRIDIPPATEHGKVLRIKGRGMPLYNQPGMFGNLYVKIKYKIPENLTQQDIEMLQKLRRNYKKRKKT